MPTLARALLLTVTTLFGAPILARQSAPPRPLIPVEPVTAILEAFQSHPIVALGEGPHGNEQGHAFRLALIRDPRFAATVNDIVVEFGSGRYQTLMDRFINGAVVNEDQLRHAWQDTTVTTAAWDRPIYEDFFRAVRALNSELPAGRRLRVLLGDAPIDWSRVHTRADVHRWGLQKAGHMANVILNEVLAKRRRALLICGDGHLQGRGVPEDKTLRLLDGPPPQKRVFIITSALWTMKPFTELQPDSASWPVPSLALIRGTSLGSKFLASFFQIPPAPGWNTLRMEDEFDAMLHLGARESATFSRLSPRLCSDPAYVKMRLERLALSVPQAIEGFTQAFRRECGLPGAL